MRLLCNLHPRSKPAPEISGQVTERLLARAAELDAAQRAALEVADLRAAVRDAELFGLGLGVRVR